MVFLVNISGHYINWYSLQTTANRTTDSHFLFLYVRLMLIYGPFQSRSFFLELKEIVETQIY